MLAGGTTRVIPGLSRKFDRYSLSPEKPVCRAFGAIVRHVANEEAIIKSHRFLNEKKVLNGLD